MDSPEIVLKSTLPPDSTKRFVDKMTSMLDADDYTELDKESDIYARLAAKSLLACDLGAALGWAWLHGEGVRMLVEMFARRRKVAWTSSV